MTLHCVNSSGTNVHTHKIHNILMTEEHSDALKLWSYCESLLQTTSFCHLAFTLTQPRSHKKTRQSPDHKASQSKQKRKEKQKLQTSRPDAAVFSYCPAPSLASTPCERLK